MVSCSEPDDARISPFDHGFTVGDGVFETCKVTGGRVVRAHPAPAPAGPSAAGLGSATPTTSSVRAGVDELLGAEPPAGRLRITLTGGPAHLARTAATRARRSWWCSPESAVAAGDRR